MAPAVSLFFEIGIMIPMAMTNDEIIKKGCAALMKESGLVGYLRFMQRFIGGRGDYTKERAKWIDKVDFFELDKKFGKRSRRK